MKFTLAFCLLTTASACPYLDGMQDEQAASRKPPHYHHRYLQNRFSGTPAEAIEEAQDDLRSLINEDDNTGARLVRLGFHDCVGGCDGCVDLGNPDNDGLGNIINELQPIVNFYSDVLTRADVWALAAVTAAEEAQENPGARRYEFDYYGRETCDDATGGPNRELPSAHLTTDELLDFFASNFAFSEQETVAIMGAHTLGRVRNGNSGFNGDWVRNEERLDNEFYRRLIAEDYSSSNNGNANGQFLWRANGGGGGGGGGGGFGGRGLIMLNSDMALRLNLEGELDSRTGAVSCDNNCPDAVTLDQVEDYANNNGAFLDDFRDAFTKMMSAGVDASGCSSFPCWVGSGDSPLVESTVAPTMFPTERPTSIPTEAPTSIPTEAPTAVPTEAPTSVPTPPPTSQPTVNPTAAPTAFPVASPSGQPSISETSVPTEPPTHQPSPNLTIVETVTPAESPTPQPTSNPTIKEASAALEPPMAQPTPNPIAETFAPTAIRPTVSPSVGETIEPTYSPIISPVEFSAAPLPVASVPLAQPTVASSVSPIGAPSTLDNESSPESSSGTVNNSDEEDPTSGQDGEGASLNGEANDEESPVDDNNEETSPSDADDTAVVEEERSSVDESNLVGGQEETASSSSITSAMLNLLSGVLL